MPDGTRPVSPVNGQPVPDGDEYRFKQGEEQRQRASKAGKRSGEVRRARKTLRDELLTLLSERRADKQGHMVQVQTAMSTALIKSALGGSVRAYEVIRDTIGEKPVENVALTSGSLDALNEAFEALKGDDAE